MAQSSKTRAETEPEAIGSIVQHESGEYGIISRFFGTCSYVIITNSGKERLANVNEFTVMFLNK
jgi:hypothetical protein